MDTQSSDWLPQVQFAAKFGQYVRGQPFSRHTLMKWRNRGEGPPSTKVGRDVLYNWSEAMDWLKNRLTGIEP